MNGKLHGHDLMCAEKTYPGKLLKFLQCNHITRRKVFRIVWSQKVVFTYCTLNFISTSSTGCKQVPLKRHPIAVLKNLPQKRLKRILKYFLSLTFLINFGEKIKEYLTFYAENYFIREQRFLFSFMKEGVFLIQRFLETIFDDLWSLVHQSNGSRNIWL